MKTYRATTDKLRQSDVRKCRRLDLIPDDATHCQVTFNSKTVTVAINWTTPNYGGERPWFACPCCLKRVAILYWANDCAACRDCHHLTYQSRRERPEWRAFRRVDTIRHKLGWLAGLAFGFGEKPHGMHWARYTQLCKAHGIAAKQATGGMSAQLDRKLKQLGL